MNYIFLDIDGVMNNRHDWMSKVDNKSEQFHSHRMFCDEAWQLLSDTCKKVSAVVILSSSWRLGFTYGEDGKVALGATDNAVVEWMKSSRNAKTLALIRKDTYPDMFED